MAHPDEVQPELWKLIGPACEHILEHFETVQPRHGDLDLAHNSVETGRMDPLVTLAPNATFDVADGASATFKFIARPGWVAHVSALAVRPRDPTQSMEAVTVTAAFQGRIIQKVSQLDYARPVMLDRDDVLYITVANASGGALKLEYALKGWLRAVKKC